MSDVSRERHIHFNALPQDVRTRLKAVFEGSGDPAPIISDQSSLAWDLTAWITLGLCGAGLLFFLFTAGFGSSYEEWAIQGLFFIPFYFSGFFLVFWSILRAVRRMQLQNRLPFPPGRYLLPGDFIDATTSTLRMIPMGDLADFNGTHHHTNGAYTHTELNFFFVGGKTEQFSIHSREMAEQVLSEIATSGQTLSEAAAAGDIGIIAAMDPLLEARMSERWEELDGAGPPSREPEMGPVAKDVGALLRQAATVALAVSLLVGLPAQLGRNLASDQVMYSEVQNTTSTWECEAYLRNGWLHTDEVMTDLLPAAAFRDASEQHTVLAMREFRTTYPGSKHDDDAKAQIHDYYDQALQDFKGHATEDNPAAVPFMTDLLTWLETHDDPAVEVRFDPPGTEALTEMDRLLNDPKEDVWDGPIAPVANNFTDAKSKVRERSITKMLQKGFEQVFPNDVLNLTEGQRLVDEDWTKPVDKPTILVSYAVGPSGTVYTSDDSPRGYVGIYVTFYVQMKVPDGEQSIDFEFEVQPPSHFTVGGGYLSQLVASDPTGRSGNDDANVYDTMALRAFDHLGTNVRRAIFKEGVGDMDAAPPPVPDLGAIGSGGLSDAELEALMKRILEDGL